MSNIDKQELREAAERAESDSWGFDRDEFNEALTPSTVLALLDELEAAEKRIAEQRGIILSARNFISEYAERGDVGAEEFVSIIDRAAGTAKGE